MAQLTAEEMELLALHYEQGYSDAQIATKVGASRLKVAVNLFRARRRVKKRMDEEQSAPLIPRRDARGRCATGGERS
jgi:DNA-directed RNA polymerase specialized sigma24 family protein